MWGNRGGMQAGGTVKLGWEGLGVSKEGNRTIRGNLKLTGQKSLGV